MYARCHELGWVLTAEEAWTLSVSTGEVLHVLTHLSLIALNNPWLVKLQEKSKS